MEAMPVELPKGLSAQVDYLDSGGMDVDEIAEYLGIDEATVLVVLGEE